MSHSAAAPNFARWAVLTNAHTIKYSPVRTLRPLLLTLFFSHLLNSESHNNTQNIDHPRCSKHLSHRDYPDNLSHHSVPTLQQPTQLPSTNHLRLSLPGNSDFSLRSPALKQQSPPNRQHIFARVPTLHHGFSTTMASLQFIQPAGPLATITSAPKSARPARSLAAAPSGLRSVRSVSQRSQCP
jgi:hypothetical protein